MLPRSLFDLTDPHHIKRSQTLPPGKAPAQRLKSDRPPSALPLSQREQQVCDSRSQGLSFGAIADRLGCSQAGAKEYYRCALGKLERSPESASTSAPLEPKDRSTTAKPELAIAEPSHQCPASALASLCERTVFHPPAVEAPALLERPNPLDL